MSIKHALTTYKVPDSMRKEYAPETVARPILSNHYIRTTFWRPWDPSLVHAFNESCKKVLFKNGYHLLLCQSRIIIVDKNQQPFAFPPFGSGINDVHIEKISSRCLLVVVALEEGLFLALVRHEDQRYYISIFFRLSTNASVSRIHRLNKYRFAVCYAKCSVELLSLEVSTDRLDGFLSKAPHGWRALASTFFFRKNYRDSFFDDTTGCMVVLSDSDIALWKWDKMTEFHFQCSLDLKREAVAVFPCDVKEILAVVILRSGDRVPVALCQAPKESRMGLLSPPRLCMEAGKAVKLPPGIDTVAVSHACAGANTIILHDELTMSLVVIVQNVQPLPLHEHSNFRADVVSQISLNERACSLSFEESPGIGDRGMFWVCSDLMVIMGLKRVSLSKLMREKYLDSKIEGEKLLTKLSPEYYAELLIDAALGGFPLEKASNTLNGLLFPVVQHTSTLHLSPAVIGFTNFMLREVDKVCEICSSSLYWEQVNDINRSRQRLLHSCIALSTFLLQHGWLDHASDLNLTWSCFEAHASHPITQPAAINAQAQYLEVLLDFAKSTSVLAWLYMLLLEVGKPELFSTPLSEAIRSEGPADLQIRYTLDLLSCQDLRITEKLLHEVELLPLKAQLAVHIHCWIQRGKPEEALRLARERIRELLKFHLFKYVCDLLEKASPDLLPTTHLLLQHYRLDPTVSSTLLGMLEGFPSTQGDALRRNLRCIFEAGDLPELWDILLRWMEQHNLDDERVEIFASLIVESGKCANFSNTLTARFFYCCCEEAQGNHAVAVRLFGELARTPLAVPLSARLVCIARALQIASSDADKLTQFLLLLQKQLLELLSKHLYSSVNDLVCSKAIIESDLTMLQQYYLDERRLFEVAGRYHALGGASIQLDILKINPDSSEEVISGAVLHLLTFLKAAGLSSEEAAERMLQEYLPSFQENFTLYPIILFLSFDRKELEDITRILFSNRAPPISVFAALSRLMHEHGSTDFSLSDITEALRLTLERIPEKSRSACVLHLLQCIRSILANENRTVALAQSDVIVLKKTKEMLESMSQKAFL